MRLRRFLANRGRHSFSGSWPINRIAVAAPDWWAGWPDDKKFAFVLTHDAEGQKGLDRCRELAEIEISLGFRSSFNFVPEGEYTTPRSLREFLTTQGFEIGVHDRCHDGKLYSSRTDFRKHAEKINQYLEEWGAVGFRSAFMLHNFDWLRDLNILYDASSFDTDPFEPQPEGVNTIFPLWVDRGDGTGYVELPYTLPQDSTLFLLLRQASIDTWVEKLEWVAQHGGLALVNVHPDYLGFHGPQRSSEYSIQLYQRFLEYVSRTYRKEAWFALPRDVAAHINTVRSSFVRNLRPLQYANCHRPHDQLSRSYFADEPPSPPVIASNDWQLCGKRVAMVTFSFYPGDPRPRRAAEALVTKGMSVDLICLAESDEDKGREILNGINVLRLPITRRRGSPFTYAYQYSAFLLITSVIIALRSIIQRYDLVYIHNMPDFLVLSALIPKLLGAKVILDLHDPMPELMTTIFGLQPSTFPVRLLTSVERWSIALADSVVTVNRACANLFTSRSCGAAKMNVVMNSPDEGIFPLRPISTNAPETDAPDLPFVIMYHGSIVERNGLDLAVHALARVRGSIPNARLRIYGAQTPFLQRVMELATQMGVREAVEYLGPKSLEQLVPAIEGCDLGVIPNRRSVFSELNTPTRIFEYLSLGKPVIAPGTTGIRDYFDHKSLVFFDVGNAADLAEKMMYVFVHRGEVTETAKRGQHIYQQHKWSAERLRLTSLVAELLSARPQVDAVSLVPESPKYNL